MAVAESAPHDPHHGSGTHHGHGEFIAHHFDSAEQQFQSGKLGIWVFLVTEVLFFSGLFVAYTLWRYHHPEIYEQAHVFLDKVLGGINTVVLLFSSLTMALGVRAAQMSNNKGTAGYVLVTMVCAAVFLGVKAIEYSHKWDQGILVRSMWRYSLDHAHPTYQLAQQLGVSDWLITLSIIPAVCLILFLIASAAYALMGKAVWAKFFLGLVITVGGYFLGAIGGQIYMKYYEAQLQTAAQAPLILHADSQEKSAAEPTQSQAGDSHKDSTSPAVPHAADNHAADNHAAVPQGADAQAADPHVVAGAAAGDPAEGGHSAHNSHQPDPASLDRDVGIFFSIYYCMTGLHAFHILGGILFLSWIYYRSLRGHWRSDYFGPVDFVGLYWHLVDLIWIYLFPLLYLID